MADSIISNLTELAETPAATDLIAIVDVSDSSMLASGTTKKNQYQYLVPTASDTVSGKVELATITETNTGTDATRAVTPDGLAGSVYGKRAVEINVIDAATALTTGDGKAYFFVTPELTGYNLVDAQAAVTTVSSSGTPTIQIANVTDSVDMLSTRITIDANEKTSYTAATPAVIDTTKDDVVTGDQLRIDVDVAGTSTSGLWVMLTFQLP
jgi:hypothetical protein